MKGLRRFTSRAVVLPVDNIDTDQIIPARFLKVTDKQGLGDHLFADWRFTAEGAPDPAFVLNRPGLRGAAILLAGDNFGCGSSREHAPWALRDYGFRAVISTSFADIFAGNALKNGLLPIRLGREDHRAIAAIVEADPSAELSVDVPSQTVSAPGGASYGFPLDGFAKTCLMDGVDELGYMLRFLPRVEEYERKAARE